MNTLQAIDFLIYIRCLGHNPNCIEAKRLLVLNLLAREGKYAEAAGSLSDIVQLLDLFEPRNHALYYEMSLAFARLVRIKISNGIALICV